MLERALHSEGFDVSVAADGADLLAAAERQVPDAFVHATFAYLSWPRSCCSRTAAWMSMRPGYVSPN